MEHWNNKNAVIRDLEKISRGRLNVDIDACLTSDKPVTCFGEEDTEEEFFRRHCSGDGNFDPDPDLDSIRKLIYMVKEDEENYEQVNNRALKVSKLNVKAPEFKPSVPVTTSKPPELKPSVTVTTSKPDQEILHKTKPDISKTNEEKPIKKKPVKAKRGNVAITSILAKQLELIKIESSERKLFKPEDFTLLAASENNTTATLYKPEIEINNTRGASLEKESAIKPKETQPKKSSIPELESKTKTSKTNQITNKKDEPPSISKVQNGLLSPSFSSPSSMFRRKTPKTVHENVESVVSSPTPEIPKRKAYVPSPYAEECYKKFVENSEMRRAVTEDLWTRTMRQMKMLDKKLGKAMQEQLNASKNSESVSDKTDVDENLFQYLPGSDSNSNDGQTPKKSEASSSAISTSTSSASTLNLTGFPDSIHLPQHRHLLTGECVVCKAVDRAAKLEAATSETPSVTPKTETDILESSFDNLIDFSEDSSLVSGASGRNALLVDLEDVE